MSGGRLEGLTYNSLEKRLARWLARVTADCAGKSTLYLYEEVAEAMRTDADTIREALEDRETVSVVRLLVARSLYSIDIVPDGDFVKVKAKT